MKTAIKAVIFQQRSPRAVCQLENVFKRELRVLALLGIEKLLLLLLLLLLRGRILSPGSTNFGVLRLVKFSY